VIVRDAAGFSLASSSSAFETARAARHFRVAPPQSSLPPPEPLNFVHRNFAEKTSRPAADLPSKTNVLLEALTIHTSSFAEMPFLISFVEHPQSSRVFGARGKSHRACKLWLCSSFSCLQHQRNLKLSGAAQPRSFRPRPSSACIST